MNFDDPCMSCNDHLHPEVEGLAILMGGGSLELGPGQVMVFVSRPFPHRRLHHSLASYMSLDELLAVT